MRVLRSTILALVTLLLHSPPLLAEPNKAPSSAPRPSPKGRSALASLDQLRGTYIEVVQTKHGLKKTARCTDDDQLIITTDGDSLSLGWGAGSQARRFTKLRINKGEVVLNERRRSIRIWRVSPQVIGLSFERPGRPARSYLYGQVTMARKLALAQQGEGGCSF